MQRAQNAGHAITIQIVLYGIMSAAAFACLQNKGFDAAVKLSSEVFLLKCRVSYDRSIAQVCLLINETIGLSIYLRRVVYGQVTIRICKAWTNYWFRCSEKYSNNPSSKSLRKAFACKS